MPVCQSAGLEDGENVGNSPPPSGPDRGGHCIAADAEHNVRTELVDDPATLAQGSRYHRRQSEVARHGIAVEAADRDRAEGKAGFRDKALLGTALTSDQEQLAARLLSAESEGDCQGRHHVPAGPAARDEKTHLPPVECRFEGEASPARRH